MTLQIKARNPMWGMGCEMEQLTEYVCDWISLEGKYIWI